MFDINPLGKYGQLESLSTAFSILMPIISVLIVAGIWFLLASKSQKAVKITKIVMAVVLIALYLFRTIFWFVRTTTLTESGTFTIDYLVKTFGLDINFYLIIISVVALLWSAFSKKENKVLDLLMQTMLGIALPLGIISLFNQRLIIDINDRWYHSLNLASMLINIAFILYPLYLVKTKSMNVSLKNFWKAICVYICICSLTMLLSLLMKSTNVDEMLYSNTMQRMGIKIGFPWHLLLIFPIFLLLCLGINYLVCLVINLLNKKYVQSDEQQTPATQKPKNDFFDLYAFATKSIACMQGFLILIILAVVIKAPQGTPFALLCLLPLVMTIFCLLAVFEMEKQAEINDQTIFDANNKKAKKFLTFVFLGNALFGFSVLKQYRNEREAIEDRKLREEKKRLKEQQKQEQLKNNNITK